MLHNPTSRGANYRAHANAAKRVRQSRSVCAAILQSLLVDSVCGELPLRADVFALCVRSDSTLRRGARRLAGTEAAAALPATFAKIRIRSGSREMGKHVNRSE